MWLYHKGIISMSVAVCCVPSFHIYTFVVSYNMGRVLLVVVGQLSDIDLKEKELAKRRLGKGGCLPLLSTLYLSLCLSFTPL